MRYEVDINIKSSDLNVIQNTLNMLNANTLLEVKESLIYDYEESDEEVPDWSKS